MTKVINGSLPFTPSVEYSKYVEYRISKSMRPTRKCEFCGKTFVPRSGMQKYCSEECQAEAKRLRKKRQQDLINGIEPIMDLQHQEYLTFSKAAILMGCTRQYIYKLVANSKLKASRLSSRMAFVRKADIEKMFEGNPYKRVIPVSKSKLSKKAKTEKPTQNQEPIKGIENSCVGAGWILHAPDLRSLQYYPR